LRTEPQRHRFGLLLGREAGPRRAFGDIAAIRSTPASRYLETSISASVTTGTAPPLISQRLSRPANPIRGFVQPFWKENRTPETTQARFLPFPSMS
jgi:hypothetical protein